MKTETSHPHAGPCALRILHEFYTSEEAREIALEFTCFPMDCALASFQALKFVLATKKPSDYGGSSDNLGEPTILGNGEDAGAPTQSDSGFTDPPPPLPALRPTPWMPCSEYQAQVDAAIANGEKVPAPGIRHFGKRSDGVWGCDTCCTGDRCDDPTHRSRRNCPVCSGSGAVPDEFLVAAEKPEGVGP